MPRRTRTADPAPSVDDPRTVKVRRLSDGEAFAVTPEAAAALDQNNGWTRLDRPQTGEEIEAAVASATETLRDRVDELERALADGDIGKATAPLQAQITELEAQVAARDTRIAELEASSGGTNPADEPKKES